MCVVKYEHKQLKLWDAHVRELVAKKLHVPIALGYAGWYLHWKFGGYKLFSLVDIQSVNLAAMYLNHTHNCPGTTGAVNRYMFGKMGSIVYDVQSVLHPHKLKVALNPCVDEVGYEHRLEHYMRLSKQHISALQDKKVDILSLFHIAVAADSIENWLLNVFALSFKSQPKNN